VRQAAGVINRCKAKVLKRNIIDGMTRVEEVLKNPYKTQYDLVNGTAIY
jgi:hypothetical protein